MTGVGVGVGVLTGIYRVVRGQVRGPDRTGVLTGKVSAVRKVCGLHATLAPKTGAALGRQWCVVRGAWGQVCRPDRTRTGQDSCVC